MRPDNRLRSHDQKTPGGRGPYRQNRDPRRAAVTLHECPRPGCKVMLGPSKLLCAADWDRLPRDLRARIWQTWDNSDGADTAEHKAAVGEALDLLARVPEAIAS